MGNTEIIWKVMEETPGFMECKRSTWFDEDCKWKIEGIKTKKLCYNEEHKVQWRTAD